MTEIVKLRGIGRSLHDDRVLEDVNMHIFNGELAGLIGLQQTGKTSLVNILLGADKPDTGRLYVDESPVEFSGPAAARQAGIYSLAAKGILVGDMTVAENLYAISHPLMPFVLSPKELVARTRVTFERFGLNISPTMRAKHLTRTEQAVVSLIQIALKDPKLIIIDNGIEYDIEDYDTFERMVLHFRDVGISFLIVSNKVSKLIERCDRVYSIRNNTVSSALRRRDFDTDTLSRILAGEPPALGRVMLAPTLGAPLLELRDFRLDAGSTPLELTVGRGEILALIPPADVPVDALGYSLFGMRRFFSGELLLEGKPMRFSRSRDAIKHGVALIPNELDSVVFGNFDLRGNLIFPYIARSRVFLRTLDPKFSRVAAEELRKEYRIDCDNNRKKMRRRGMSFSDLHRISVARWEPLKPRLYIFTNPFSVLDEQTSGEVRDIFERLASNGCGVLILSTNTYGLKSSCTRIVRM